MKKGFTLIELLAVIVILAIIALISTPIVIDIIEDAKINSVEISTKLYLKAVKLYTSNAELNKVKIPSGTYPIMEDGNLCIGIIEDSKCTGEIINIDIKGNKPNSGRIIINENNIKIDYLEMNGYVYYKDNDKYILEKLTKETKESNTSSIILDNSKVPYLTNYRIYGNSYQETSNGKNKADPKILENFVAGMQALETNYGTNTDIITDENGRPVLKLYSASGYGHENYTELRKIISGIFKENTRYTISFDYYRVMSKNSQAMNLLVKYEDGTSEALVDGNGLNSLSNTVYSFKYTSKQDKTISSINLNYNDGSTYIYLDTLQIEEGTTKTEYEPYKEIPSPQYPSEIKSVGDLVTDQNHEHYGEYKILIKVTGKNIALNDNMENPDANYSDSGGGTAKIQYSKDEEGYYTTNHRNRDFGKLKPGIYTLSLIAKLRSDGGNGNAILTTDNAGYGYEALTKSKLTNEYQLFTYTFEVLKERNFKITIYNTLYFKDIQLEKGSNATAYEPYKDKEYNIYLDEPLRCINGICDYIDYTNQQLVRNIYKDKLATLPSGKYTDKSSVETSNSFYITTEYDKGILNLKPNIFLSTENLWDIQPNILADNLPAISLDKMYKYNNIYGICATENEKKTNVQVRVSLPTSITTTSSGFKNWLKENDSNVYYVMLNPSKEAIELPKIDINKNQSNIFIDTSIKPSKVSVNYYK